HTTTYDYTDSVSLSHHLLRLKPRDLLQQRCMNHEVTIDPAPAVSGQHIDYFGNAVTFVTIEGAHQMLTIESMSNVSVVRPCVAVPGETLAWESVREFSRGRQIGQSLEASEFIFDSPFVRMADDFSAYAAPSFLKERPIFEAVLDLTARIHRDFKFDPKATTLATPLEEVFKNRRGVCQDFAQLEIACLRSLGLPARYVSGYLETDPPLGKPRLVGADASHAWISFYCHGIGWLDIDPTNNVVPTTRHIAVAYGRDYNDVSPIHGVILGTGDHTLDVSVDVVALPDMTESK
ncbi:MAG TPA: transglutaminase family protein, partial [Candidatus Limnocylindria bacterium]|nr:transglutaminase family protein [Candidatus Limnocylindria bacterium]